MYSKNIFPEPPERKLPAGPLSASLQMGLSSSDPWGSSLFLLMRPMAEAFTAGPMELSAGGAHPALSPHQARNRPFPPGAWWFLVEKDTQEGGSGCQACSLFGPRPLVGRARRCGHTVHTFISVLIYNTFDWNPGVATNPSIPVPRPRVRSAFPAFHM